MMQAIGPTGWRLIEASPGNCQAILSEGMIRGAAQTRAILFSGGLPKGINVSVGCSPLIRPTIVYFSPGCGTWADHMVEAMGGKACDEPDSDSVAWGYRFETQ